MLQFFIVVLRLICYIFNQKNSSMLCIGVNRIKFHFDTSQLCRGPDCIPGGCLFFGTIYSAQTPAANHQRQRPGGAPDR